MEWYSSVKMFMSFSQHGEVLIKIIKTTGYKILYSAQNISTEQKVHKIVTVVKLDGRTTDGFTLLPVVSHIFHF